MRKIGYIVIVAFLIFMSGCSSKKEAEYNKPAIYWYEKIIKSVSSENLDKADEYFTSLESEHISSPFVPEAMLILAQAHMDNEEYLMANFYIDEYIKRYGTIKRKEFAEYLKIKASFLGFKNINRDQKLLQDTIKNALNYKKRYANSEFVPLVDTILTKLYMTEYVLNKNIMLLYQRRDKSNAAKIYEEKLKKSWLEENEIVKPQSWYDILIEW